MTQTTSEHRPGQRLKPRRHSSTRRKARQRWLESGAHSDDRGAMRTDSQQDSKNASPASPASLGWLRLLALMATGALALLFYLAIIPAAEASDRSGGALAGRMLGPLLGLSALFVAAVALVWYTQPAASRNWRWVEFGVILLGGVALRVVVFGAPPALSHDAYRYAWDAHLLAHGLSPYTHTPLDPSLARLRDRSIWPNLRFRTVPTLYPPAAQALYLLAHLVAPLNITGIKAVMVVCDALSGLLTLALLRRRSLDLRRVILYWWAPLPILEFAYSAHVDAEAILWTLAALVVNGQRWRGARFVTGVLLGLATLTKLYPLLFVVAVIRRRDYSLLAGLLLTLALGYAPFVALGLGGGGFLGTYFSQRFIDQGLLLELLTLLVTLLTWSPPVLILSELVALALLAGMVALARWRLGLTAEAGVLALSAAWVLLAPHLFPWYVAALLPFIALYLGAGRPHSQDLSPNPLSHRARGAQSGCAGMAHSAASDGICAGVLAVHAGDALHLCNLCARVSSGGVPLVLPGSLRRRGHSTADRRGSPTLRSDSAPPLCAANVRRTAPLLAGMGACVSSISHGGMSPVHG